MTDLTHDVPASGDPGCLEKLLAGKQIAYYYQVTDAADIF